MTEKIGVLLAMPCPFAVLKPFFDCVLRMMLDPELAIYPYTPSGTVIHLARHDAIEMARKMEEIKYLCFLDTDQLVDRLVLRRLVRWCEARSNVHVVAPIIVQRSGDPVPVAYKELGIAGGTYRYQHQGDWVAAYLSQFPDEWYTGAPSGCLPLKPMRRVRIEDLPPGGEAQLEDPLMKVDAVGAGMVLISREACQALEPDPITGLYCSFQQGGEDFEISRRLRKAGYSIWADRGCWVGHMTTYSRGVSDLVEWQISQALAKEQEDSLPKVVPDLLNDVQESARKPSPWEQIVLPGERRNGRFQTTTLVPA